MKQISSTMNNVKNEPVIVLKATELNTCSSVWLLCPAEPRYQWLRKVFNLLFGTCCSHRFEKRALPGAHVRRHVFRICAALVLPPSLKGVQTVCLRRMWWKPEPLLFQRRVPELVWQGKERYSREVDRSHVGALQILTQHSLSCRHRTLEVTPTT